MGVRKVIFEGQECFEAYWGAKSKTIPRIRKQRSTQFDKQGNRLVTESAARIAERRMVQQVSEEIAKLEGRGYTFGEIVDQWETHFLTHPTRRYSLGTVRDNSQKLRNWAKDWLSRPATEINRGDARRLFDGLVALDLSYGLIKSIKSAISVIYTWGIEQRLIQGVFSSPVLGLEIDARKVERKPEILSLEQIKKLLSEARDQQHPWYPVWTLALLTGCRSGELQGLRVEDCSLISLEAAHIQGQLPKEKRNYGTITVDRAWNSSEMRFSTTKGKYWRMVPVSSDLYWFLQKLMENNFGSDEFGRFLLPVFEIWRRGNQAAVIRPFCEEIRIPSVCFHTLRACFATHLLQQGVPGVKVMRAGGWKDLKTMERYMRLAGVEVTGITEKLEIIPADISIMENVVNLSSFRNGPDQAP